jgi:phage tail sheath gpL-like
MAIDALRDGFVRLCFDPSLNVYRGKCRILLEGQVAPEVGSPCAITLDQPMKIASLRQVDCQFGAGSVLAESLKVAFGCCPNNANEIWVIPRADAAAAVKAAYTLTITGPVTEDGRIDIYWGDARYNISVRAVAGETETQVAAKIVAAIPAAFPYTAVAAAGVITLTAKNGGTVGNYLNPAINWHGRLDYFPEGVNIAMAQTVVGSVDPVPLVYTAVLGECCYCCVGMLYEDNAWQDAMIAYLDDAWSCTKPQCFGQGYMYAPGTLGQILSQFRNKETVSILAHCPDDPHFPWLKVAAYAAKSCCSTVDNPELSVQGPEFGVLECLLAPESCSQCFTYDEQVQLKENGFVVTVPLRNGQGALSSPEIANDITNYLYDNEGRPNATWRDTNSRRLAAATAVALANKLQTFNGLGLFTKNTDIRPGVRGTNPRLMLGSIRAWAKTQIGVIFSEFDDIDEDIKLQTSFEVDPKCQGRPDLLYLTMVYRPPVRVGQIITNLQPKLLDNCN